MQSRCDRCGETVDDIDAGFSPGLHEMAHGCGGTWRVYREACALVAAHDATAEEMRRHVQAEGCEDCRRALQELLGLTPERAAEIGARGGVAGRGAAKRRGGRTRAEVSEYYRALAAQRKRPGRKPKSTNG